MIYLLSNSTVQKHVCFFLSIKTRSGLLAKIGWSIFIRKSQRILCVLFSRTVSGLCMYPLSVWSNFSFLHNSQWINIPTQWNLLLYFFCANLLFIYLSRIGSKRIASVDYFSCFVVIIIIIASVSLWRLWICTRNLVPACATLYRRLARETCDYTRSPLFVTLMLSKVKAWCYTTCLPERGWIQC